MLAPDWPPVGSAYTPGTSFMMSAVLLGDAIFSCSSLAVVIENDESSLRTPPDVATPVTTTCCSSAWTASPAAGCVPAGASVVCGSSAARAWLASVSTAREMADSRNRLFMAGHFLVVLLSSPGQGARRRSLVFWGH